MTDIDTSFTKLWSHLESTFTDQDQRERLEGIACTLGSVAIAAEIPVFGEIQLGLQVLDFIDPYGYNQAINRDTLDSMLQPQFQKIVDMQNNVKTCYTTGTGCDAVGITQAQVKEFQALPASLQEKRLKTITSWANPYPPEVNYPDMLLCTLATDVERIEACKDPDYKRLYKEYWNQHINDYTKSPTTAYSTDVKQQVSSLITPTNLTQNKDNQDTKKKVNVMLVVGGVILVAAFYLMASKVMG
jgi:hypothetical protein